MSRFRRVSHTAKDRYNEAVQYEPQEEDQNFQNLTPEPYMSVTLPVAANIESTVKVGSLIKGMQRADKEGLKLREAVRKKRNEEVKSVSNVKLNIMSLQDKQFEVKGNIFNIAVGEIDRQAYLSKLNNQISELKSRISAMEGEQKNSEFDKAQSSNLEKSRTIEERKSHCGRIYSRLQTPNSERKYIKFRSKQIQNSTYYKWRPEVDENNVNINGHKGVKAETDRSFANYRVKQRSAKVSASIFPQNQNNELKLQSNKKTKTDEEHKVNTEPQNQTKTDNNPELQQKLSVKQEKEPYSGLIFQNNPEDNITSINDDFRTKIVRQLQIPKNFPLQSPQMGLTIEQYEEVGRKTFAVFEVKVERESSKMVARRFRNGVYFQLGGNKNILWYFSGSFYLGGWDTDLPTEGQKTGFGFEYVPDKYIYLGEFKEGMKHGKGSIQMLSGHPEQFMAYEGDWSQGKPHGMGKHIDEKGTRYIGSFLNGEKTGKATILSKEGLLFEGEVLKGIKNGYGVQKLINGDSYMGNFSDGKFHGQGVYTWKNASTYEGDFVKGKRQGMGIFKSVGGDQFEGEYFDDLKEGWGRFTWANGQIYEGEFKKDIRHGEGTYRHPSGKVGKFMWNQGQIQHRIYSKEEEAYRCRNLKGYPAE